MFIFKLCSEGRGHSQIANQLTEEQFINPSNHYFNMKGDTIANLDTTRPYRWTKSVIVSILDNKTYL